VDTTAYEELNASDLQYVAQQAMENFLEMDKKGVGLLSRQMVKQGLSVRGNEKVVIMVATELKRDNGMVWLTGSTIKHE